MTTDNAALTIEEASAIVGDDIAYWLENPFMPTDLLAEKVCWWIERARASAAEGADRD